MSSSSLVALYSLDNDSSISSTRVGSKLRWRGARDVVGKMVLIVVGVCIHRHKEGSAAVLFPRGILDCESDGVLAPRPSLRRTRGRRVGVVRGSGCKSVGAASGAASGAVAVAIAVAARHWWVVEWILH